MNDHNLDDLIIDNIEPKNGKAKSLLTIIALLIVILIIAIILTKIILKDPTADDLPLEENITEMISPELTLQSAAEPKPVKKEPELSNIIENALKAPVVEEVTKKTIEPEKKSVPVPEKHPVEKETVPAIKEVVKTETPEKIEIPQKKAEPKKEVEKVVVPVPPKIIEKAKERPTGKPVNIPKPKSVATQTYYIQVGSFTQTPSSQFLSIIKNSGFNYKITPATSNGTKKLLIGPYKDRKSVDTALVRVRDRINKSAFVVKK
jgi:DedD protein